MGHVSKDVSSAVIGRLPRYIRFLKALKAQGRERVSSRELGAIMDLTDSQIRQDLNNFGAFGLQGYGYSVAFLEEAVSEIIGLNRTYNLIIVGAGRLGQAAANYLTGRNEEIKTVALFDRSPEKIGTPSACGMIIKSDELLEGFLKENEVDIAVLTVSPDMANSAAERVVAGGVKGIWNFTLRELDCADRVPVVDVHLSDSLQTLIYQMNHPKNG